MGGTSLDTEFGILVVDDDVDLTRNLRDILEDDGYRVAIANDAQPAIKLCRQCEFDLALMDIRMHSINGIELIDRLVELRPGMEYIIITAYAALDTAIAAVEKRSVIGYETKPIDMQRLLSLIKQVSERRQAESRARESERSYRLLAENVSDVIWTAGFDLKLSYISPSVTRLLGYAPDEIKSKPPKDLFTPTSLDTIERAITAAKGSNPRQDPPTSATLELELTGKDSKTVWTETKANLLYDAGGRPVSILGVSRDITGRKEAEEKLRLSESRLREAQLIARLGNWDWNLLTNELHWSDEIYHIFGLTPQEFGATYAAFLGYVHPADREFVQQSVNEALHQEKPYCIDHRIILPDGHERFVHEDAKVTFDEKGQPVRMAGTVHDITELKTAESELRALSRRLLSIQEEERRQIASELHDQIGQSLTMLKLLLNKAAKHQGAIGEAMDLTGEIIGQLRNISLELRPSMLDDLGLLPTLLWHFERFTSKTQVKVNFKHSGLNNRIPPDVSTAAYRITQEALANIIRHAGVNEVNVFTSVEDCKLKLYIEDCGSGFDPSSLPVDATGGIYGMRERAKLLGGKLEIESSPGVGTIITAELPLPGEA